jgi:transposase
MFHDRAKAMHEAGYKVSLVNPALMRAFSQSQLKRTKIDKADAILIARFCNMHQPPPWTPTAPEVRELQALVRRVETLEGMRVMEENRLGACVSSGPVRTSLEDHLGHLHQQIENTRRQIKNHIDQNPSLKVQAKLLESISGSGEATAALLLAELGNLAQFGNSRQVAAFAGLVPHIQHSGSSVRARSRLSKAGSPRLRKCLYFPAIVALPFNPVITAFGLRLSAAGKSKMLIVGAAMRKLLHLAYGVLKSRRAFDPHFLSQNT